MAVSIYNKTKKQGFTLIETFVAITILMIAILGPMSIIAKFYADSSYAKHQISAAFLAQDGMETVQNIIKTNTKTRDSCDGDWLVGLDSCKNNYCNVDSLSESDGATAGKGLLYTDNDGFYVTNIGTPTIFSRGIKITNISEPAIIDGDYSTVYRSAQIISEVTWSEKGKPHTVTVSSLIVQSQCLVPTTEE